MNKDHLALLTDSLIGDDSISRKVLAMPYLIIKPDSAYVDQIQRVTGTIPGLWAAPPVFDEMGVDHSLFDGVIDLPFSAWANQFNQTDLRRIVSGIDCPNYVLVDSSLDEEFLRQVFGCPSDLDDQAIMLGGLSALDDLGWFSLAVDLDAEMMLFLCARRYAFWIRELKNWAV